MHLGKDGVIIVGKSVGEAVVDLPTLEDEHPHLVEVEEDDMPDIIFGAEPDPKKSKTDAANDDSEAQDHLREILGGLGISDAEELFDPEADNPKYLPLDRVCCLHGRTLFVFRNRLS